MRRAAPEAVEEGAISYEMAVTAARAATDMFARDVVIIDLREAVSYTDYFIVASAETDVVKAALTLHGFLTVCTSTISQKASLLGWSEEAERAKAEAREIYRRRGEFLIALLEKELNLRGTSPEGAFYTMVDVRPVGAGDLEVAERFLQNRVITVPGVAFGSEAAGFLRVSFCNSEEKMAEGVRRMKEALK